MAVNVLNDNFEIRAPKPVDSRLGYWDDGSGSWQPFNDRAHALSLLEYRAVGLTVPVMEDGEQVEYWFVGDVEDEFFVLKTSSPVEAGSGIHIDGDGKVALGLDLATLGTTNDGALTDPTILSFGDITEENSSGLLLFEDEITQIVKGSEEFYTSIYKDQSVTIGRLSSEGNQFISIQQFNDKIFLRDDILEKGLEEFADYSANKTQYSYVTVKMLGEAVAPVIIEEDPISFSETSATLNASYPDMPINGKVYSDTNNVVYIKQTETRWSMLSLI